MAQGYANDVFNRNLVLALFFCYYMYLRFVFSQFQRNKNWKGVKCNPLEMVIGSIFDSENSNDVFEKCMQYPISDDIETRLQEFSKSSNTKVDNQINRLTSQQRNKTYKEEQNLNKALNAMNALSEKYDASEDDINELKNQVAKISNTVNNTFDDFKSSANELLTNLKISNE